MGTPRCSRGAAGFVFLVLVFATLSSSAEFRPTIRVSGDFRAQGVRETLELNVGDAAIGAVQLGGPVQLAVAGELGRRDGLTELAVVIASSAGAQLVILKSPHGAMHAPAYRLALPFTPRAMRVYDAVGERLHVQADGNTLGRPDREGDLVIESDTGSWVIPFVNDQPRALQPLFGGRLPGVENAGAPNPAAAAVRAAFVVNSVGDLGDASLADGLCDSDLVSAGLQCTLRAALEQANSTSGADTISFAIGSGPATIEPSGPLPAVTETLTLDASTQPGFSSVPLIELRGDGAGDAVHGLVIEAPDSIVRGFVINRFSGSAIRIAAPAVRTTVAGCFLGLDASGTFALGNGENGIEVDSAPNNLIGGRTSLERNVISGNRLHGVSITGVLAVGNRIEGNYIGLDATGSSAVANRVDGVRVADADTNTIGGSEAGTRNVISGNGSSGVHLLSSTTDTLVQGNALGTDATEVLAIGNQIGLRINGAPANTIGGYAPLECAGNPGANLISGNASAGVQAAGLASIGNRVQGNLIGTQRDGRSRLPNAGSGIAVVGSDALDSPSDLEIGGSAACRGNTIASNATDGVSVGGASSGVSIIGNLIHSNSQEGIDLANDGVSGNDAGDGDNGPNRRQNTPVIERGELRAPDDSGRRTLIVTYTVDSDPAHSSYPLSVEFFRSPRGSNQADLRLGAASFSASNFGTGVNSVSLGPFDSSVLDTNSSITAIATDTAGNSSEFAGARELNVAPTANADEARVPLDTATTINVIANDSDPDGALDASSIVITRAPGHGRATPNADGTVNYTPDTGFEGTDSFGYSVADLERSSSDPAEVTLTISSNQLPQALDDAASVRQGRSVDVAVLANDSDPDGTLDAASITIETPPTHGTATPQRDGTVRYQAATDYLGQDQFSYSVADRLGGRSEPATVTMTVNPNQPPTTVDDSAVVAADRSTSIAVLLNDSDGDGELAVNSIQVAHPPAHGSATPQPDGTITYQPQVGYVGDDAFSYTVADEVGARSEPAEVSISVRALNSPPLAGSDRITAISGKAISIRVLVNDSDPDETDQLEIVEISRPLHGTALIEAGRTVRYVSELGYSGRDFFLYRIEDGHGGSDSARVDIDVVRGPDLIGRWAVADSSCNESSHRCRVSGSFIVTNAGLDGARNVRVDLFLSTDATCTQFGRRLKSTHPRRLAPGQSMAVTVRSRLAKDVDPTGLCLMGTIDPRQLVEETDEENNSVSSSPLP